MVLEVNLTYKLAVVFAIDFSLELPREGDWGKEGGLLRGLILKFFIR